MNGKLILARHHESEYNKLGKWQGRLDIPLTDYGIEKSKDMGLMLKNIHIDIAFTSGLTRTVQTLNCMLDVCEIHEIPTEHLSELNERDYGIYTGKNKWEMRDLVGEEEFKKIRRGWNHHIPEGETLKDVYERVIPCFLKKIFPLIKEGKNVLVVGHGNSLRSIVKYIENISEEKIVETEFPFGGIIIYDLDANAKSIHKEIYQIKSEVNA